MQKIIPHLWYDSDAETAARRYVELVPGSALGAVVRYPEAGREIHGREPGSVMTVDFRLGDTELLALNGGPHFRFTPAISLFVVLEDAAAVDRLWQGLSDGGNRDDAARPLRLEREVRLARRPLGPQLADRARQARRRRPHGDALAPLRRRRRRQRRPGDRALHLGLPRASVDGIMRYDGSGKDAAGTVMHGQFRIDGQAIMAMDSARADAAFNEAVSLLVNCEDQAEIDRLWSALSAVPEAEACGWLKDRFGVSWQIAPRVLGEMMASGDRAAVERLTAAFMKMKKLDLPTLERAYAGNETVPS